MNVKLWSKFALYVIIATILGIFAYQMMLHNCSKQDQDKAQKSELIDSESEVINVQINCNECNGTEVFTVLNIGQKHYLNNYDTKYYCDSCKKITQCTLNVEIKTIIK